MNPGNPLLPPFDQILVETATGCFVRVARTAPAVVLPLCAAAEPPSRSRSSAPADAFEGGSNSTVRSSVLPTDAVPDGGADSAVVPARRRRAQGDLTERPSPAATDMIGRFQMIISIVESTGTRADVGDLMRAVQRLKLATGELRQKRQRRPAGTPEIPSAASGLPSSVLLLEETIAAMEQMRLSEPMEKSLEYAEVLDKLKELLRTEKVGDG